MSKSTGARRGTRIRRARTRRPTALDYLMVAGIVGGGVYLILTTFGAPVPVGAIAGVLGGGVYLGQSVRVPRFRSPIVWRRHR